MRLLIAEDDSALRVAIRLVLEGEGHEVVLVESLDALLGSLIERRPDMILIDAGMDGAGVPVWRTLVARPEWAERILLMTGNVPALGDLAEHPAVLGKPFDYGALVARIAATGSRPTASERSVGGGIEAEASRSA